MPRTKWWPFGPRKYPLTQEERNEISKRKLRETCRQFFPSLDRDKAGNWSVSTGNPGKLAHLLVENAVDRETIDEVVKEYRDKMQRSMITASVKNKKAKAIYNKLIEE